MIDINLEAIQELANKYQDLEQLFRQLPSDIRMHSIRVAEYSQALYLGAVEAEMNPSDKNAEKERNKDYAKYVYKVGKYHDIGVLCLPNDHPLRKNDATALQLEEEETHPELGEALCDCFALAAGYEPTIYWNFLLSSVRMHHEKPDGGGFPDKLVFDQMTLCPWLVSLAVILDVYTAYNRSEDPFKEGFNKIMDFAMKFRLDESELVLRICKAKLEKIFESHISETKLIKYGELMIKRTAKRSMYLSYRRVNNFEKETTVALQAIPMFYAKSRKEVVFYDEIKERLKEEKMVHDVWEYFLYEASDMRKRINAYGHTDLMLHIPIIHGTISNGKVSKLFDKWLEETETDISQYAFMIEAEKMKAPSKTLLANLAQIKEYGAKLVLTDFTGSEPFREEDLGVRFDTIQISPILLDRMDKNIQDILVEIVKEGYELQSEGIDSDDYNDMLEKFKFKTICGEYVGDFKTDSEILMDLGAK